jgi:hypothetical protein
MEDKNRVPSNIMLKSSYFLHQNKEPNYITDTILELYNYILSVNPSEYNSLEIEAKLGTFLFKGSCVQAFKELKETFKIPIYNKQDKSYHYFIYDFNSGLEENQFYSLWYFVNKESERSGSEIIQIEPITYKETHYKSGIRKSVVYKNNIPGKEELIQKKDKHHVNIRNNSKDFRITACKEEKQYSIPYDDVPVNYREKFRASYKFRFFRLDFTIVTAYKDLDVTSNKEMSYEVEFEFEELNTFLTRDYKTFEDFKMVFLRFIQNVFCIYEMITPEYYYSRYAKPRFKEDSIFGDYMEKNFVPVQMQGLK